MNGKIALLVKEFEKNTNILNTTLTKFKDLATVLPEEVVSMFEDYIEHSDEETNSDFDHDDVVY